MDWDRVHCCSFKGRTLFALEKSGGREGETVGATEGKELSVARTRFCEGAGCGYVGGGERRPESDC